MTSCILLLASCGAHISSNPEESHGSLDAGPGAAPGAPGPDAAPPADAAPLGLWSAPAAVTVAATPAIEDDVTLTSNALEMVYAIADPMTGKKDLYYTSRAAIGAAWLPAAKLPFDRTATSEEAPRFSADDRTLYFASDRAANDGNLDIYAAAHAATTPALWGPPQRVAPLTTAVSEKWLSPCSDGHYVVVQTTAAGDTDLYEGTLGSAAPPAPISGLNTTASETGAFLTTDCLTLYFASFRVTPERIFVSHRATVGAPWQPAVQVDEFKIGGGTDAQEDPWLAADGHTFAFASNAAGTKDVYLSTR
jgi:WD40 repeat protein